MSSLRKRIFAFQHASNNGESSDPYRRNKNVLANRPKTEAQFKAEKIQTTRDAHYQKIDPIDEKGVRVSTKPAPKESKFMRMKRRLQKPNKKVSPTDEFTNIGMGLKTSGVVSKATCKQYMKEHKLKIGKIVNGKWKEKTKKEMQLEIHNHKLSMV